MLFETFPFPRPTEEQTAILEDVGERYHEHRRQIMLLMNLGLTKTYNLFHTPGLSVEAVAKASKQDEDTAALAHDALHDLRTLHRAMDEAVLHAYAWQDLALRHDFYEVDVLPENDRVCYTIHPETRKEILGRLLKLNHARYAEEQAKKKGTPQSS